MRYNLKNIKIILKTITGRITQKGMPYLHCGSRVRINYIIIILRNDNNDDDYDK